MRWTWKYADWLIVAVALLVGLTGFLLPSNEKELDKLEKAVAERKAKRAEFDAKLAKAIKDHEELTAREREEYGIVYVPVQPPPKAAAPAAPAKKPE